MIAIDMNRNAFRLGRLAAHDQEAIEAMAAPLATLSDRLQTATCGLEDIIERRVTYLAAYQDAAYTERYRKPGRCAFAKQKRNSASQV